MTEQLAGTLALVGGAEWRDQCTFDRDLLDASGGNEVAVLPTASAYEKPDGAVAWATRYFEGLGAKVRPIMVLRRPDAEDEAMVKAIADSAFLYLGGGSPLHLRSVLKDSPVWDAIVSAWRGGAVVAGSSAGAMVLCDPMVDPRGGAFTLGLGLIEQVAFIPHHDTWSPEKAKRTIDLAAKGLPLVAVDEQTALIREPAGTWRSAGAGSVTVFVDGAETGLDALPQG
jgi:cyanophycinase